MSSYFLLHGQRFSLSSFVASAGIARHETDFVETRLIYLQTGLFIVKDERSIWSASPGQVVWLPAGTRYDIEECGNTSGVVVSLAPILCAGLPEVPCPMTVSGLVPMVLERVVTWQQKGAPGVFLPLAARQERLLQVLLDELHEGIQGKGRLILPKGQLLNHMAHEILARPEERRGIEDWASRIKISSRSINRHFSRETGMTFAKWRQGASLLVARKLLAEGESVQNVSSAVGYENVSAFIASFKKVYGQTPAHFRQIFE